jgi:hypothetical protein
MMHQHNNYAPWRWPVVGPKRARFLLSVCAYSWFYKHFSKSNTMHGPYSMKVIICIIPQTCCNILSFLHNFCVYVLILPLFVLSHDKFCPNLILYSQEFHAVSTQPDTVSLSTNCAQSNNYQILYIQKYIEPKPPQIQSVYQHLAWYGGLKSTEGLRMTNYFPSQTTIKHALNHPLM